MKHLISTITLGILLSLFCFTVFAANATDYCDLYTKLAQRLDQVGKDFDKEGGFDLAHEGHSKFDDMLGQTVRDARRVADGEHDAKLTAAVGSLEKAFTRKEPEQFRSSLDRVIAQVNRIHKQCKQKPKITAEPGITIEYPDGSIEESGVEPKSDCQDLQETIDAYENYADAVDNGTIPKANAFKFISINDLKDAKKKLGQEYGPALSGALAHVIDAVKSRNAKQLISSLRRTSAQLNRVYKNKCAKAASAQSGQMR